MTLRSLSSHWRAARDLLRNSLPRIAQLETVRNADQILVLDRGRLLEQGSQAELLRCGKHYREIWEMQIGSEAPRS